MTAVPVVTHAYITKLPKYVRPDNSRVEENTHVRYACVPGYELVNPHRNFAKCVYRIKPVYNTQRLFTAIWAGHEETRCKAG